MGNWRRFESAVHHEFADDELILKELEKLTSILTATREQVAEKRRIARRQSKARPTRKDNTPATAWAGLSPARVAKILLARFLADTRIAGQLATETGRRALYLSQVYVHRKKIEDVLVGYVRGYLETEEPPEGQWLSIEGDAGHGKTSLLWWLAGELQRLTPLLFPVQALQLDSAALEELRRSVPLDGKRFVVILDTLDLLVGADDLGARSR